MTKNLRISSILFLTSIVFASCEKKGCTDRNAVNYDVTANVDDGSCIICNQYIEPYDHVQLPLVDKRTISPYYNDTVGIFHLNQYFELYSDQVCGEKHNYIELELQNLVGENMQVEFDIEEVFGPVNFYYGTLAFVEKYSTTQFQNTFNISYPYNKISLDSLKVTLTGYIQYY